MPTAEDVGEIAFKVPKGPILTRMDVKRPHKTIDVRFNSDISIFRKRRRSRLMQSGFLDL